MKKYLLFFIVGFVLLSACIAQTQQEVKNLEPMQVKELLDKREDTDVFVLNVHTPYEGKLEGTDAIIEEWEQIAKHQDQLPVDKNTPILVYCRSGRMSISAVDQLKALGYTNLFHLDGGMKAWDAQGLPIIDKAWK